MNTIYTTYTSSSITQPNTTKKSKQTQIKPNQMKENQTKETQANVSSAVSNTELVTNMESNSMESNSSALQETAVASVSNYSKPLTEKEKKEEYYSNLLKDMHEKLNQIKKSYQRKKKKPSYDATLDLMALSNAETIAEVKKIQSRLILKAHNIKVSCGESIQGQIALVKIKKVISKTGTKIKKLTKEIEIDRKRKAAHRQEQEKRERKLEKELQMRRRNRKAKEKEDVIDSLKGRGANFVGANEIHNFSQEDFFFSLNEAVPIPVSSTETDISSLDSLSLDTEIIEL